MHRLARALAAGSPETEALRSQAVDELAALAPIEELCAYPGPGLLARLRDRLKTGDWAGFARLAQRISIALLSNSYRDDPEAWRSDEDADAYAPDVLPPGIGTPRRAQALLRGPGREPGRALDLEQTRETSSGDCAARPTTSSTSRSSSAASRTPCWPRS